jgi:nucleoside-diphosphate-sugar epimerase
MFRILVIGSNGFLGSHVFKYFNQDNFEVWRGVRENSIDIVLGDEKVVYLSELQNRDYVLEIEFDCVVFCGSADVSLINDNPSEYLKQSILLPFTWLHSLAIRKTKQIIWIGSYWQEPVGEGYQSTNLYSASKQAMQDLIATFVNYGIHVSVIHLGDLYGVGDQRKKLIPLLIESMLNKKQILIKNPQHIMRPIWYLDVLNGLEYLMKTRDNHKPAFQVYSMVGPTLIEVNSLVQTVIEIFEGDASLVLFDRVSSPPQYSGQTKYDFPIESFQQTQLRDGIKSIKKILEDKADL